MLGKFPKLRAHTKGADNLFPCTCPDHWQKLGLYSDRRLVDQRLLRTSYCRCLELFYVEGAFGMSFLMLHFCGGDWLGQEKICLVSPCCRRDETLSLGNPTSDTVFP